MSESTSSCLVAISGGLDSSVMLHHLAKRFDRIEGVSIYYGQRHNTELHYAEKQCDELSIRHDIIDLSAFGMQVTSATLTNPEIKIPDWSESAKERTKNVVPMRNTVFLSVLAGMAAARDMDAIAIAPHKDDAEIYPDCRPGFYGTFRALLEHALPDDPIKVLTPFLHRTKADIVKEGFKLGVDFQQTWTCYSGADTPTGLHCGRCPACVGRRIAFRDAGFVDPTLYEEIITPLPETL